MAKGTTCAATNKNTPAKTVGAGSKPFLIDGGQTPPLSLRAIGPGPYPVEANNDTFYRMGEKHTVDYNKTLNLPKTEFAMRASLPQREPDMLKEWEESERYEEIVKNNQGKPTYILHDGPPYANGDIHLGTALNKVLKDMVVRYKNIAGFQSVYIPGWDTHGLPIERKALQKLGVERSAVSPVEIRRHCREFAEHYMGVQRDQFKRLGVLGDFENPYLTLQPEFEAKQIQVFGEMAKKGYIYKGLKPVYWCTECGTALAEAEIEYAEDPCYSIYVKFQVKNDGGLFESLGVDKSRVFFVIWTTTTWTLPGNVAICLGPNYEYSLIKAGEEYFVLASELAQGAMRAAKIESYETVQRFTGAQLERVVCAHPFLERDSLVILGEHVTLESGTGCVHTAPGHGVEDFEVCVNSYPELTIVVPVDDKGLLTAEAGRFAGLSTDAANKAISQFLEQNDRLFAIEKIVHQYPHCWRCKSSILFRATEQWFCSVEAFKEDAVKAIDEVEWVPEWGRGRITNMVRDRSDWCISRQRVWGVPIPIFYCESCGKEHVDDASIEAVSALFRQKGSDAWFTTDACDILPAGTVCKACGATAFTKETDIMDVWFDSGCSHAAVLDQRDNLSWPADLYLEGADQYRGWFQSSLLTAVAMGKGSAPYKTNCTHGWVVDGEGRKMSKSIGNGIDPKEIVEKYGADILRLWVASSDYHADIRISDEILKQLSESYRKIRNTARYILGNLSDFDPERDMLPFSELPELDRWALVRLSQLTERAKAAYDRFDFHIVYHAIHNYCTIDLSNFYLDVIKDRLYVEKTAGPLRRAAQSAMYRILRELMMLLAPIICYTAEEIWRYIPADKNYDSRAVMFNCLPTSALYTESDSFLEKWERLRAVRDDVNKALELARNEKLIGKALEAAVTLYCEGELYEFLSGLDNLAEVFIVSQSAVKNGAKGSFAGEVEGLSVAISKAEGEKCERCWTFSATVGNSGEHPTLCARCAGVITE